MVEPHRLHPRRARRRPRPAGFTLVEILIVVVILGVLAAIVIPQFAGAAGDARDSVFVTNLVEFSKAAQLMQIDTGDYPPDGSSGAVPAGFDAYIEAAKWTRVTPIGGVWDAERNDNGIGFGVGVHFDGTGETQDAAYMARIDTFVDNGDVASGGFREIAAQRYYNVIEP